MPASELLASPSDRKGIRFDPRTKLLLLLTLCTLILSTDNGGLMLYEDYTYYSRKAINNHVSNLRKKIRIAPDLPDYIKSVYGVGYKFDV